jgi:hypothetical protein
MENNNISCGRFLIFQKIDWWIILKCIIKFFLKYYSLMVERKFSRPRDPETMLAGAQSPSSATHARQVKV